MLPKSLILLSLPLLATASPAIPWHKPYCPAAPPPPAHLQHQPAAPPSPQQQQQHSNAAGNFPIPRKETSNKSDVFRVSEGNSVALFNGIPVDLATGHPIRITNTNDNPGSSSKPKTVSDLNAVSSNANLRRDLRNKLGLGFLAAPSAADATTNAQAAFADSSVGRLQMSPQGPVGPPQQQQHQHQPPMGEQCYQRPAQQYGHNYPPPPPPRQQQGPPPQHQQQQQQFPQPAPRQVAKFPAPQQQPQQQQKQQSAPVVDGNSQEKQKLDLVKAIADGKDAQGNKWMVYNGKPMKLAANEKPTRKALSLVADHAVVGDDADDWEKEKKVGDGNGGRRIFKRDIQRKLGLGMFDLRKSVKAVGNAAEHAAASAEDDEYDIVDPNELDNPSSSSTTSPSSSSSISLADDDDDYNDDGNDTVDVNSIMEDDEADPASLPNAKSFAIYNGVPVEIDGKAVRSSSSPDRKMKKPRPAFPRASNHHQLSRRRLSPPLLDSSSDPADAVKPVIQLHRRSASTEAGKKIGGFNPYSKTPVSATRGSRPVTKEEQLGDSRSVNVRGQEKIVRTPRTSEEETVRVLGGENYRLYNGRPCGKVGVGRF